MFVDTIQHLLWILIHHQWVLPPQRLILSWGPPPTCVSVQGEQPRQVAGHQLVGDPSIAPGVRVCGDGGEDLRVGRGVAADAGGVLLGVEHRSVVVQVLHLDVHVGLSAEPSLGKRREAESHEELCQCFDC